MSKSIVKEAVDKLIEEKSIAIEKLTRDQTASLIIQIIASGDIHKYVTKDGQAMTYEPFRTQYMLTQKIDELNQQIEELQEENNALKI